MHRVSRKCFMLALSALPTVGLASAALADDYMPVDEVTVTEDGKVRVLTSGEAECISLITGSFSIVESRWQRRGSEDEEWNDVAGTRTTGGACGYIPTEPGEYRLVADVVVDGVAKKWASANTLKVAGEGDVPVTAVSSMSWGELKSKGLH